MVETTRGVDPTAIGNDARLVRNERPAGAGPLVTRDRVTVAVGLLLVVVLDICLISMGTSYYLFILNSVLLAIIGASALNMLQGTVGQVSIGNVAFLVVGAFSSVAAQRAGIGFPWDLVLAMAAGAVAGAVIGLPALRIQGFYLAFATLAAHFIFVQLGQSYQNHAVGAAGFVVPLRFANESLVGQQRSWAILLSILVVAVLLLVRALTTFRLGRTWRIIRDHEIVAPTLGIRVALYKMGAFMVSSALIALQGGLAAHLSGYVSIDTFTLTLAVSYVAMILIGGEDSLLGSVVGAVVVISLPYVTSNLMDKLSISSQYSAQTAQILYGVLVVIFVVFSSGGIAGWLRKLKAFAVGIRLRS